MGALLVAGLFFVGRYFDSTASDEQRVLKPSQIDFTKSNEVQEKPAPVVGSNFEGDDIVEAPAVLNEREQKLWRSVESVLRTKNDSDPAVNELKGLSADFHKALFDKYNYLKMEDRNGRGFIVFLVAKNLRSSEDLEFLQKIYQEAPCLSLENCAVSANDDSHSAGVNQTTTIYPQLVGLYQIEKQLNANPDLLKDAAMRAGVLTTLKQAEAFSVPAIHEFAAKIRQKFNL